MADSDIPFRPMLIDEFVPLVGKEFLADCEPGTARIMLLEASPSRGVMEGLRPPFTLIFHTPPDYALLEGSYVLRCGNWGPDRVFLSPIAAPPAGEPGYYYQAVFN